jgi:DNA-directed RNA polymerase specialized sigma24 family protein
MTQQSDSQADHKAIDLLAKAHIGWVYTLARRQLGDAHLADDATQAVFIALWKKHKRLVRIDHPIGGWLLRATHYACANIQKKQQRQKIRERKAANMRQKEILSVGGTAMDANAALLLELDAAM